MKSNRVITRFFCLVLFLGPSLGLNAQTMPSYDFLFIHHSVGYFWLATGGLYASLLNPALVGGRRINVHSATYGDDIGWNTDMNDWRKKFRDHIKKVLTFDSSKNHYYKNPDRYNKIVMFKGCFNNVMVKGRGRAPGDPDSKEKNLWNFKATMEELALLFDDYPHVLFLFVTSPPQNPYDRWVPEEAALYREFANWVKGPWLKTYYKETGQRNVAVFDLFDVLADVPQGCEFPNALKKAYRKGKDSHPNPLGLNAATKSYLPLFNKALTLWEKTPSGACNGTNGKTSWLHENGRAFVGNVSYALRTERVPTNSTIFILSSPKYASQNLGKGCYLRLVPFSVYPPMKSYGFTSVDLLFHIPKDPNLVGLNAYFQGLVTKKGGGYLGQFDFTNMLRIRFLAR